MKIIVLNDLDFPLKCINYMPFIDNMMKEFTTCTGEEKDGNLLSLNQSNPTWNNSYLLDLEDVCVEKAPGIKVLPFKMTFQESINLCAQMQSQIYTYQASLNSTELATQIASAYFEDEDFFWTGYTDELNSGVFLSLDRKQVINGPDSDLKWLWGQPNGGNIENCTVLQNRFTNLVIDISCKAEALPTCQFLNRPKFLFRGEQSLGLEHLEYFVLKMDEDLNPTEYYMKSFYGATIEMSANQPRWTLKKGTHILATQNTSKYFPVGTNSWKNENDDIIDLNLNACDAEQFSCDDGTCIHKYGRCDQTYDCLDESDELSCDYVNFPKTYNKLLPPRDSNKRTKLTINIGIKQVLAINILKETFRLKFHFESSWTDSRLGFSNLQEHDINVLEPENWISMWVPTFLFHNTKNSISTSDMVNEEDSSINLVLTNTNAILDDKSSLVRNFNYKGSDVIINKFNVYTVDFMCSLDLTNYPFDIQTCPMIIKISTSKPSLVDFNVTSILYASTYSNYKIHQGNITSDRTGVQNETIIMVPLILVRDIKSIILNTYLPTFILTLINQLTNYYIGYAMFEAVITINATTLLTLTSLFISVFNNLPETTNIKLIDVWMLTTFVYPFIIIIIHTMVHVNSGNQSKKARFFERIVIAFGKVVLPFVFGIFTIVYAAYGAHLLNTKYN